MPDMPSSHFSTVRRCKKTPEKTSKKTSKKTLMSKTPARHLELAGASNFRDLGGYPARGGRTTRWRRIFRSNHLGHLTDDDIAVVRGLGVARAFDFRGVQERQAALCLMDDVTVHSLPVEPTVVATLRAIAAGGTALSTDHAAEVMRESYRGYVQQNTPRFRALFAHMLEDRTPLVIHCTAGKDRTGFACALILHAFGVSEDIISEDYLLTNRYYRRDPNNGSDLPEDVKNVLGTVQSSFLGAAFEAIDADYGDLESYFRDGLGLGAAERTALEGRYLQD